MTEVVVGSPAEIPHARRLGVSPAVMRALPVLLGLHGVAHLAGTGDSFTKAADGDSVDYLAGAWTLSDPALLRAVGVVWALVGAGFVFAAAITWMRRPGWPRVLAAVSALSLVVVVIALWSSVVGVVIDVALLAVAVSAGGLSRAGAQR
jgi:hypothetical protein